MKNCAIGAVVVAMPRRIIETSKHVAPMQMKNEAATNTILSSNKPSVVDNAILTHVRRL
jgi:hypothetical protein